ncbi:SDR family NAD(P)-dependent oxidoreductase [Micromonosporaceae bacterium Da 78-11]
MVGDRPGAEPVAVIGMSCRLPQAADTDAFWRLLSDGTDAVTEAPRERWPAAVVGDYHRGGFLADVAAFDAAFFGISPNEAAAMDPQQRLVLELAWEALEHSRIMPGRLRGSATGVFVGAIAADYAVLADRLGSEAAGPHTYTGGHRAIIANRVSYLFGLRGPSLTLDTGQSSSLVAVHLACESLRHQESEIALAGGVNLNLLADTTAAIGRFGALSADGRCHVFDERANGYVRGEGGALVVLKPLAAALRDGDTVHAVILGGAVNNDGGGDWLTSPSRQAQQDVITVACARSGVRPAEVGYVELHGTGTPVGDPIEAAALGATLGADRLDGRPLLVGSVKTNIGHLEGAAGIAGLLKVVLSLKHRRIPGNVGFRRPPASIDLDRLGLRVAGSTTDWPSAAGDLVAGISSFGMGGTNCHLVLRSAPTGDRPAPAPLRPADRPWVLSGRSAEALQAQAAQLVPHADAGAGDVALALLHSRTRFEHRAVVTGDPAAGLAALAASTPRTGTLVGVAGTGQTVFVFPGQGSQWPGMASRLLDESPEFAALLTACADALDPFVDYRLTDVLRETPGAPGLDRVDVVQPALWAVLTSLAGLWRSHGVHPDMVIGHSQGEIAAATAIGALSLADGARVVALRSRALAALAGSGGMLSLGVPLAEVRRVADERTPAVTVAAVNGPRSVVVSGPLADLAVLQQHFEAEGDRTRLLPVDYASHSPQVEQIRAELARALAPIRPISATTRFVSTVTGEPMDTAGLDAAYWYRSLRDQVRFDSAVGRALADGAGLMIECSPHPVLVAAVAEIAEQADRDATVIGTLRRQHGGAEQFDRALAEAFVAGADVDFTDAAAVRPIDLVDLPTYPFQRERYWLAPKGATDRPVPRPTGEPVEAARPIPSVRSRRELQGLVLAATADVLGYPDPSGVQPERTFKDLGVDSATAVVLRDRLRTATGLTLPTSLIFDHPTPDRVAGHLYALTHTATTEPPPPARRPACAMDDDPIVLVAAGCRLPGDVATPEDLWALLSSGGEAISDFPVNRGWDAGALFADGPERSGTSDTRRGGFLHDADEFDAAFFGISPREAGAMDPQQRVLLEVCWETVERAGIDAESLHGSRTGVFIGAMAPDYGPPLHQPDGAADGHLLTGSALSVVSGRIAYTLGLQGPALTLDTACSSSLVAIHLAAQALRRGECTLALAGGVTVMSSPGMFVEFSRQHGLAPDGRCKAFSAAADGTGWAEGAAVVLLERLSDARRNGRRVLAVLRGSAVNSDGRSNGMTAPNGPAQEQVIRAALADAGLRPADVAVVEAHGTGTRLGDPIEAQALIAAYGPDRPADRPLWLGSVKSNIGHTQAAAGAAGVVKMMLALGNRVLPATLHADESSPYVDWSGGTVALLTGPVELSGDQPVRAGISSFGISGTNAHLILETPPAADPPEPGSGDLLVWVVSARTEASLRAQAGRLHDFAVCASDDDLAAVGGVLARRTRFEHRAVVVVAERTELLAALAALTAGTPHPAVTTGVGEPDPRPVFLFPGQGSQWDGMAVDLLDSRPAFADELRRCDAALRPYTGWSVQDVLRATPGAPELAGSAVVQPVLFAVMVALAALWRSIGVTPAAVVGQSQGEITAAVVAGALTLEQGARMMAQRAVVVTGLAGTGGMLAVALPGDRVRELLVPFSGRLWSAIRSGPASTVVAGEAAALEEFAVTLGDAVQHRRINVDYASHCPHIDRVGEALREVAAGVSGQHTDVVFSSSLTGGFLDTTELTPDYWYRGTREQVRFEQAVGAFVGFGTPVFIEASPHPSLIGHVQDTLRHLGAAGSAIGSLRRGDGSWRRFLGAAAQAFVLGAPVDWAAALPATGRDIDVPTYAFDRRRYWTSPDAAGTGHGSRHPLLGTAVPLAGTGGHLFTGLLSLATSPWLGDHAVDDTVLLPATAFIELALEAAGAAGCDVIEDLTLAVPLVLPAAGSVQVQVTVDGPDPAQRRGLAVHARPHGDPDAPWVRHATATVAPGEPVLASEPTGWPPAGVTEVDVEDAYDRLADLGYAYGPAFQGLVAAWRRGDELFVEVALPEPVRDDADRFTLHPALLDAALHLLVLDGLADAGADDSGLLLPFSFTGVRIGVRGARTLRVRVTRLGDDRVALDVHDDAGHPIASVESLSLARVPRLGGAAVPARPDVTSYAVDWVDAPVAAGPVARRWALIGDQEPGFDLAGSGIDVAFHYDLPSLTGSTAGELPATVLVSYRPEADPDDVPYCVREGLVEALDLVQAWVTDDRFAGSRLVFVTRGVHAASAGTPGLIAAPLWGLIRAAQAEHPDRFALVDLSGAAPDWGRIAAALDAGETQLAVRDGAVLMPRLARVADPVRTLALDPAGTVLVTGGTSGLGALAAERLVARHGVRHVLLASRRGAAAPGADELVARLEELGAAVTVAACDVSDRRALAELLAAVPAGQPLTGVVHAAGVLDDATVEGLSAQRIDSVFRPKVDAAWLLHEATRELPLAMFVLFSSVAGTVGNAGQGNYAAANVFLDELARYRRGLGLAATSMVWGLWDAGTAMTGAVTAADVARLARTGIATLGVDTGLRFFDLAPAAAVPVLVAARWDTAGLRAGVQAGRLAPVLRSLVRAPRRQSVGPAVVAPATTSAGELAQRVTSLNRTEAATVVTEAVRALVALVLGHASADGVDADRAFSELGFDSLTAVELRNRLDTATGLRLPATVAFDYPTVTGLAGFVFRMLAPAPPSPEELLRGSVDRVAELLPDFDEAMRGRVVAVLQSALARLEPDQAGAEAVQDHLRSASDDEIFAFIDNQL